MRTTRRSSVRAGRAAGRLASVAVPVAVVAVVVSLVGAVLDAGPAAARPKTAAERQQQQQRQEQIKQELRTLREQVEEASAEESDLLGRLDAVEDQRRVLDAKVGSLDAQIRGAQRDVDVAQERLDQYQAEFVRTQGKLQAAEAQVLHAKAVLRRRAVAAYLGHPTATAADAVLKAKTFREVAATVDYLETIVEAQRQALDRFSALRDDIEALRTQVELTKDQALAQRDEVRARQGRLEAARAAQEAVRQEVLSQEREQENLLSQVRDRKADFEGQIAALRAESSSISAFLRGVHTGQTATASGRGVLAAPVPGRITSTFGSRVHPILKTVRAHDGVDFAGGMGTPIRAAGDGVVVSVGVRGGYGNTTIIDHGGSLATLYAHQSSMAVATGQRVGRGQIIGYVGSTGFSTGPHLHFEVRAGGTPVDPLGYL